MDSFIELFKTKLRNDEKMTPKQQAILKACVDLFSERGFSNTSTSQIAERAQVAEGTIYKHFGTKENLLYATVLPIFSTPLFQTTKEGLTSTQAIQPYPEKFETLIHQYLYEHFQFFHQNYQMIKIFVMEMLYQEDMRKKLIRLVPRELIEEVYSLLDYYKKSGQIVAWDNDVILRLIFTNILSYVMFRNTLWETKEVDDQQQLAYIETFIVRGLTINSN